MSFGPGWVVDDGVDPAGEARWPAGPLLDKSDQEEDLATLFEGVTFLFWMCPDGHSDRTPDDRDREPGPTVEWRGDVAYCLTEGCDQTSKRP